MGTRAIPEHTNARAQFDATLDAVLQSNPEFLRILKENGMLPIASATVNAKTLGDQVLYTVPAGYTFYISKVVLRVASASAATGDCELSIKANTTAVVASAALTGLNSAGKEFVRIPAGLNIPVAAGETVKADVDVVDSGTALSLTAYVYGYLG